MLLVLFECPGEVENVVKVGETDVESLQNVVHEGLECLGGDEQAGEHERELE
jgi:hypothetical protein